jgi:hypothetical protein
MRTLRLVSSALLCTAFLTFAACGGGGGGGGSSGSAVLRGSVLSVNGSTANLGGIRLYNPGSGRIATTLANGTFSFGDVPAGTVTIRLAGGLAARVARSESENDEEGEGEEGEGPDEDDGFSDGDKEDDGGGDDAIDGDDDDDGDDKDVGDDDCDVSDVEDGEEIEIRIRIRDGGIESVEVGRSGDEESDEDDERECARRLERCEGSDDDDIVGIVRGESGPEAEVLVVVAEDATPGRALRAVLRDGDAEASLGVRIVSEGGRVEWVLHTGLGADLPFDATSLADLVGVGLEIRDAESGLALLCGEVPELPTFVDGDDDEVDQEGREGIPRVTAPEDTAARVKIKHRTGAEAREVFEVYVEGAFEPGTTITVWLQSLENPDVYVNVGELTIGSEHEGELEISTAEGDELPLGVGSVADLVGLRIQLRSAANAVLFAGEVPALNAD